MLEYDRVTESGEDSFFAWYLWDCRDAGQWLTILNKREQTWSRAKLPNPVAPRDGVKFTETLEVADAPRHTAEVEDETDD